MASHKYCLQVSWVFDHINQQEIFFCVEDNDVYDSLKDKYPNDLQQATDEYAQGLAREFLLRGSVLLPQHGNFETLRFFRVLTEEKHEGKETQKRIYAMKELDKIEL